MDSFAIVISVGQIAAAIALLNGFLVALGQARIVSTALEAISRQPGASGSIINTMFIGLAMSETTGIYGLLIAIIMLFANPLVDIYLRYLGM